MTFELSTIAVAWPSADDTCMDIHPLLARPLAWVWWGWECGLGASIAHDHSSIVWELSVLKKAPTFPFFDWKVKFSAIQYKAIFVYRLKK